MLQLAAEEHVVDDVEVVAQREVLVDDLDAEGVASLGPCTVTGLPSKRYSPASNAWMPAIALDQGALAGAVVADEGGDLPGSDVEVDAAQDVDGAEALVGCSRRLSSGCPGGPPSVPVWRAVLSTCVALAVTRWCVRDRAGSQCRGGRHRRPPLPDFSIS